jgi:hypothetical protein
MQPAVHLSLTVGDDLLPRFCLLAGSGFMVGVDACCSVRELLCGRLCVSADYLDSRIQTIFLDGKAVDDPRLAGVRPGSTVALSAAMPGIAGAMFRRGSPYAPMRSPISDAGQDSKRVTDCRGDVVIRLFNAVQAELGPVLLGRGVWITGKSLSNLFRGREKAFGPSIITARLDGEAILPSDVFEIDWHDQKVFLRVGT